MHQYFARLQSAHNCSVRVYHYFKNDNVIAIIKFIFVFKAAVFQLQKKWKNINGKYWSSYVQWRNLLY